MNDTIMITGGAGFIGSHLADALIEKNNTVIVVDNLSTGMAENVNEKAIFYKEDVGSDRFEDIYIKHKPSVVFMLAFNTDVPRSVREPLFDAQSLTGSIKTLELARKYECSKIVFSSSSFIYGNAQSLPVNEMSPMIPDNPYIITKYAVENYIQFYRKTYGLNSLIFRYATTFGPRQTRGAMADYIRSIKNNKQAVIYGDGNKTRDYLYVKDVVRANIMAMDYSENNGITPIFNLSSGKETTLNELYKRIGRQLGSPDATPRYESERPGELMRMWLDSKKAKELLGWEATVGLEEGLALTVAAYLGKKVG